MVSQELILFVVQIGFAFRCTSGFRGPLGLQSSVPRAATKPLSSSSSSSYVTLQESVALPKLEYGYRTEPLDWSELVRIISVEKNFGKICRTEEQQRAYEVFKEGLKDCWKSVTDFVLCTKFGFERRVDVHDGLGYAYPSQEHVQGVHKRVARNDFPHYIVDNVEHWVLWKLGADCEEEDIEEAKAVIQSQLGGDVKGFLHWINPQHLKSLPDIDHAHILCLRERKICRNKIASPVG